MKQEIIDIAVDNLNIQPGIQAEWIDAKELNGTLKIKINGKDYHYFVEVKNELRQYQITQLGELQKQVGKLLIVAKKIYPKLKQKLIELEIPYLEANGNFFIKEPDCFCLIDTRKDVVFKTEKANRAFTKTGLKVLFHFLNDFELINKKQREIARITGVALGNIPLIISGLKETGYLLQLKKGIYIWEKKEELINRWVNEYATELRPKLIKGKYHIKGNWKNIKVDNHTVWGGEPAADILTQYLRPEKFILYTQEKNIDLMKKYKIIPGENGELEILDMFWNNEKNKKVAPPLLIYTELMLSGEKRNLEAAQLIYNEYIKPKL